MAWATVRRLQKEDTTMVRGGALAQLVQLPQQPEPVQARQHHVRHQQLRPQPPHQVQGLVPIFRAACHMELAGALHPLSQHGPKLLIGVCQYHCYLVFHFVPTLFHTIYTAKAVGFTANQHLSLDLHIIYQDWTGFSRGNCRILIISFRQNHVNLL